MDKKNILVAIFSLFLFFVLKSNAACVHTEFSKNASKHFLNDLTDKRLLATETIGR
jgi:hypothetical protein